MSRPMGERGHEAGETRRKGSGQVRVQVAAKAEAGGSHLSLSLSPGHVTRGTLHAEREPGASERTKCLKRERNKERTKE